MKRRRRVHEPTAFDIALGAAIRRRRRRRGLSLDLVSSGLRLDRERVGALEEGRRRFDGNEAMNLWRSVGGTGWTLHVLWRRVEGLDAGIPDPDTLPADVQRRASRQRDAVARMFRTGRDRVGLSLREAGRRAGVSASTVRRIERGETVPRFTPATRLQRVFGLSDEEMSRATA